MRTKHTDEEFIAIVLKSKCIREALTKLSLAAAGGNYNTFHKRVKRLGLKLDHFTQDGWSKGKKLGHKRPIEAYLSNEHSIGSYALKNRILSENILPYQCCKCKNIKWENEKVPLELDHIDGDNANNNLSNLRLLCPNCHAQTDTYRGKNIKYLHTPRSKLKRIYVQRVRKPKIQKLCLDCPKQISRSAARCKSCTGKLREKTKINWPSQEELLNMLAKSNYSKLGRQLGVSDNAIRKRLQKNWCPEGESNA